FERAVVNTHHRAAAFEPFLSGLGLPVDIVYEPEILGTAGGVANAKDALGDGDVLVYNGDILLEASSRGALLADLLARHAVASAEGALATWAVAPKAVGQGTVGMDAQGRIVRLRGRLFGDEARGGDFLGVMTMSAAMRSRLPARGCLVADAALPAL